LGRRRLVWRRPTKETYRDHPRHAWPHSSFKVITTAMPTDLDNRVTLIEAKLRIS